MKILLLVIILLISIFLINAYSSLNSAGDSYYLAFATQCETVEKYRTLFTYAVNGNSCDGGGLGYEAELWDHSFWLTK
jgi:hypothetical protein